MSVLTRTAWPDWRSLVLPALFLAVWSLVTALHWVNPLLIVSPSSVLSAAVQYLTGDQFWPALAATLFRAGLGLLVGGLAGLLLGLVLGLSRWSERLLGLSFHGFKQVSIFAWIPLLSIWLGYNDLSRVVFISVAVLFPVALATFEGIKSISLAQFEVARVYGFSRGQLLIRLVLPAASPQLLTGLKLAVIYAWLATIGAEFLLPSFGDLGLGDILIKGRAAFRVEQVLFGLLLVGSIGWGLNRLAARLEQHLLAWRGPHR